MNPLKTKLLAGVAFGALFATAVGTLGASAQPSVPGFFPERPSGATTYQFSGVLQSYGVGNKSGAVSVKDDKGSTHVFYVGIPFKIDGTVTHCSIPPVQGQPKNADMCDYWPSGLTVGSSHVRVIYWVTEHGGQKVAVAQEIDELK